MKTAIYMRVSTAQQNVENQRETLLDWAARMEWEVHQVYVDDGISAVSKVRPAFTQMMNDAKNKDFDMILVFQLSRFGRSLYQIVSSIHELASYGVSFYSMSEHIDTRSENPMGVANLALFAAMAQIELQLIKERISEGIKRAQNEDERKGVNRWAKQSFIVDRSKVLRLRDAGLSWEMIAEDIKCSKTVLYNALKEWRKLDATVGRK